MTERYVIIKRRVIVGVPAQQQEAETAQLETPTRALLFAVTELQGHMDRGHNVKIDIWHCDDVLDTKVLLATLESHPCG
jgi:hypothetical protein